MNKRQGNKHPETTVPLVSQLADRQDELGLNDTDFAQQLEISRPLWWMTRSGDRRINVMLLSGVAKAFPDLDDNVLAFLRAWMPK